MSELMGQVGSQLRTARQARNLTLEELAEQAAMSVSTLSRLESGKRQANLELLVPLCRILDIKLDDLVPGKPTDPRIKRPAIRRNDMMIAPLTREQSPVHSYKITYPPVTKLPTLKVHDGYEWFYVLSGRLRLRLGEQDLILTRGEAAEFDTRIPHAMSAHGSKPAQVISIFNETGERMHLHTPG